MESYWVNVVRKRLWNVYLMWFLFSLFTVTLSYLLHRKHPIPLVDEVFHIPQAMNYCAGEFLQWNPKITTLPGLYFASVMWLEWYAFILRLELEDLCNTFGLRLFNVFVSICNFLVIYKVQRQISTLGKWCDDRKCVGNEYQSRDLASAINLSLFPVLYFFSFFYYTEQLSTLTVLMTYSLYLSGHTRASAVMGFASILVRQSNVIWIGFIILNQFISLIQRDMINTGKYRAVLQKEEFFQMIIAMAYHIIMSLCERRDVFLGEIKRFIHVMLDYIIVCIIFAAFVLFNGGIVVGDKLAHKPVFHFPQLLYFILFASAFCMPYFVLLANEFHNWLRRNYLNTLGLSIIIAILVNQFTFVHPYLLADNRHYTFYVWKLLFERNQYIRYILIPVYVFGGFCILHYLGKHSFAYKTSFLLCILLILVPQKLLEFRYFITPFLMFRLNVFSKYQWQLWCEFLIYFTLNLITLYLFHTREIFWSDISEVQRLMW